jgi:hypothetical protein
MQKSYDFVTNILSLKKIDTLIISLQNGYNKVDWDNLISFLEINDVENLVIFGPLPQYKIELSKIIQNKINPAHEFKREFFKIIIF